MLACSRLVRTINVRLVEEAVARLVQSSRLLFAWFECTLHQTAATSLIMQGNIPGSSRSIANLSVRF